MRRSMRAWVAAFTVCWATLIGCSTSSPSEPQSTPPFTTAGVPAGHRPLVGTAVAGGASTSALGDGPYRRLLAEHFDLLTPENQMKWSIIHPGPERYDFRAADDVAAFARTHGQHLRGHTLLWYGSLPEWVRPIGTGPCSAARRVLRDHIHAVVSRYRDIVSEWDVANEVLTDGGVLRTSDNPFLAACGESIVADAFRWTREADPEAVLYLNEYGIDRDGVKLRAFAALVTRLRHTGAPLGGIGFQAHETTADPAPADRSEIMRRFASQGLATAITEADVRVGMFFGRPVPGARDTQAAMFAALADDCVRESSCRSFTLWGVADRYSWTGRPTWGLGEGAPLDDELRPKPAWTALEERFVRLR